MFGKITLGLLKELSSSIIYGRGEEYYDWGAVDKVRYYNDTFTASVQSSHPFTVSIQQVSGNPQFYCNCPDGGEYICEHCVAAALKVIHEPDSVEMVGPKRTPGPLSHGLETLLKKATRQQKDEFIQRVLRDSDYYREAFRVIVMGQVGAVSEITVEEIRDQIKQELGKLDFPETESFPGESIALIENAIVQYKDWCMELLESGNIVGSVKVLLGLYEGMMEADAGTGEELTVLFPTIRDEFIARFKTVPKDGAAVLKVSEIINGRNAPPEIKSLLE